MTATAAIVPVGVDPAKAAPMPGGVGPMTVAMLIGNVVEAAERRAT